MENSVFSAFSGGPNNNADLINISNDLQCITPHTVCITECVSIGPFNVHRDSGILDSRIIK
jgi:hypothetical protein